MVHDFGSGMTVDELIEMRAGDICSLKLPPGKVFETVEKAAVKLDEAGLSDMVLKELWEDGHSIWCNFKTSQPIIVTPTGQIRFSPR